MADQSSEPDEFYFRFVQESPQEIAADLVWATVFDSTGNMCFAEAGPSDTNGYLKITVTRNQGIFKKKISGEINPGVDLFFYCRHHGEKYKSRKDISVSNTLGLYCEGRDPNNLVTLTKDKAEKRYLRKVLYGPNQEEKTAYCDKREGVLKEWFHPKHRCLLLTGPSGSGKTSILRQALSMEILGHEETKGVFCASFELDNSTKSLSESFAAWVAELNRVELVRPITEDSIRELLSRSVPITLVLDGVDEMSNSDRDRGAATAMIKLLSTTITGASKKDRLGKHGLVLTSRTVPDFIFPIAEHIHHFPIIREIHGSRIKGYSRSVDTGAITADMLNRQRIVIQKLPAISRFFITDPSSDVIVPLNRVRGEFITGDILLSRGSSLVSKFFCETTGSEWSRVGILVNYGGNWFVFESSSTSAYDNVTGIARSGAHLVLLSDWLIQHFESMENVSDKFDSVAWRPLLFPTVSNKKMTKMLWSIEKQLQEFRKQVRGRPYEGNFLEFMKPLEKLGNEEDLSSVFSCELVVEAYKTIGLLPETIVSNRYTPFHFSSTEEALVFKEFVGGFRLEREIYFSRWANFNADSIRRCRPRRFG